MIANDWNRLRLKTPPSVLRCSLNTHVLTEINHGQHSDHLFECHRQDEDKYISMYQQHNADLTELMKKDREIDMEELDKAWTAANPET
jgi:hypothetical protein